MPEFDLRGMKVATYSYSATTKKITYGTPMSMGDAMTANLEMKFAEGRLYAESALAEYMKKVTGMTISQGVKYIPDETQKVLFKAYQLSRTVGSSPSKTVKSMAFGKTSTGNYVGSGFYAPDMVDGTEKFTAVFVHKALFGPPSKTLQTMGETITFATPTTTGEALVDDNGHLHEWATLDTEAEAIAWIDACFTTEPTVVTS
nr:MAG TPA: tail tube protein [Caudoviricetes sp.]